MSDQEDRVIDATEPVRYWNCRHLIGAAYDPNRCIFGRHPRKPQEEPTPPCDD